MSRRRGVFLCNFFLNSIPSQSPLRVTAPPYGSLFNIQQQTEPLLGERCRACRGGGFFVQLFSELYPLSVTLTGDSSPLWEPLLKFYFLRFHNQFQRRHNLLYLITNAIKIFINSIIRKSYYCYSQIIKISCPSFIIFSMLIFVMLTPIQFNYQLNMSTIKICNIFTYWLLFIPFASVISQKIIP